MMMEFLETDESGIRTEAFREEVTGEAVVPSIVLFYVGNWHYLVSVFQFFFEEGT